MRMLIIPFFAGKHIAVRTVLPHRQRKYIQGAFFLMKTSISSQFSSGIRFAFYGYFTHAPFAFTKYPSGVVSLEYIDPSGLEFGIFL